MKELDFSDQIRYMECFACELEGIEQEISEESWASEKNKGKKLNKPFRTSGGPKKFSVYVKNDKGNVVKVNFGDPNMEIKRDDPNRRKNFRARHNCDSPGPKWKAKYWSCRMWSGRSVNKITKGSDMSDEEVLIFLDESEAELTKQQKSLPPALQKKILDKKGKKPKDKDKDKDKKEESEAKRGLWDNIRDKKKRMGKNYRPAKPGDKDRPDSKSWKKAQKKKEDSKAAEEFKPHKMYDKSGKAYTAKTKEDHLKMKKMGYTHEDPKMKSESGYKKKKKSY
jgi:hypothetical protein